MTYVLGVYIIVNKNMEGLMKLNQTYPDVVAYYVASAQFTWAKIFIRAVNIICL